MSEDDFYQRLMARIDELMELDDGNGPAAGTAEAAELDRLSRIAEEHESRHDQKSEQLNYPGTKF